jgi:hypothetical protein
MILNNEEEVGLWVSIWLETHPALFPVLCSEIVDFLAEYRVYCVLG